MYIHIYMHAYIRTDIHTLAHMYTEMEPCYVAIASLEHSDLETVILLLGHRVVPS